MLPYYYSIKSTTGFFSRAIMKFHSMKMEEINKIIRDLWRSTYRGQGTAWCVPMLLPKPCPSSHCTASHRAASPPGPLLNTSLMCSKNSYLDNIL